MKTTLLASMGTLCAVGLLNPCLAAAKEVAKSAGEKSLPQKPNVVIFLVDDMGAMDVSFMGSTFYETPNIDRMASEGMVFTNGYAACTVSSPTRAAMMTGKYPARLHLTDWIGGHNYAYAQLSPPAWKKYLDPGETTLADLLKAQGYATWHVGKWHLGDGFQYDPQRRGFDINLGGSNYGSPRKGKGCNGYFAPYCLQFLPEGPEGEYLTERLTAEAVRLIETSDPGKPFFLNFCHYAVHQPLMAHEADIERWKTRVDERNGQKNPVYAAMVEDTDKSLGAVLDALRRKGALENTLVIFTSDNGGLLPVTDNTPFRAGKGSAYEGGVRVPLAIMWKGGGVKAGSQCDYPVITMDVAATVMEAAGAKPPTSIDGVSMIPLLHGKTLPERALYWHYPHYHPGGARTYAAIRQGDWKLIEKFEDNSIELYNLRTDVGERNDLSGSESVKAAEMLAKLKKWQREVGAQMPLPNPDYDPKKATKVTRGDEQ